MRLRTFIHAKDFDEIQKWISDERTHALWSANRMKYPLEKEDFQNVMQEISEKFGDSPFVATTDDGKLLGFFCYSLNLENNEGMLKFVIVNPSERGKGIGKEMLRLALRYAFEISGAESVQLIVFSVNERALNCYKKVGFVERESNREDFVFKGESWKRCNMVFTRTNKIDDSDGEKK